MDDDGELGAAGGGSDVGLVVLLAAVDRLPDSGRLRLRLRLRVSGRVGAKRDDDCFLRARSGCWWLWFWSWFWLCGWMLSSLAGMG